MKKTHPVKDYFTFSRKDRLAAGALLLVLGGLIGLPYLMPDRPPVLQPLPDSLVSVRAGRTPGEEPEEPAWAPRQVGHRPGPPRVTERFPFDPNELDAAGWVRLGLPGRVAGTILKYRDRGGRFRRPEDLRKIWSLPPGFYEEVAPYIRIAGAEAPGLRTAFSEHRPPAGREGPRPVALNEADSAALERLPGIGAKLASRIIRFRDRLGGFHRVEQVAETWGLPDSTFRRIQPYLTLSGSHPGVRKFNLNSATKEELKVHPYLRWNLVNALIEYRNRHGNFQSVADLKKVLLVSDSLYERIAPYFTVE
ncbi:helix-hairpin-helix domain-containing protein [Flaviaesturariibacter flavus]|uniref:Helix-hairpin-helix domain-containing protein n=1 Tax=Flaviaesturariibacter flavus TaxID=2502780 RepID=A0A4R1BJS6_9BACT|nr:helix-hairpin-helix domain-containing protein [Flaviaesturariibacter flavus]TCJ17610.1 helix-hairpin-helix domain-containing protein [Flaviaesturariibacter flavus]